MAFVSLHLEIQGETSGEVLEHLAEIGYTVSEGLAAQEELELSDVCNACRAAEDRDSESDPEPEDPYEAGAFYVVMGNPSGELAKRILYYSGFGWYEVGNNEAVDVSGFVIGDKLDF